jgi:TfoX/Sxy family transcriptional regulator of competence genes
MASDRSFVEFIIDQIESAGSVSYRKMFGEYAIYCNSKVVALICKNQLFVKQTDSGRSFIGTVVEAPPYSGAKLHFLIEDRFEDREWISNLIKITAEELPEVKHKTKKIKGKSK